jgi:hypothetical protein
VLGLALAIVACGPRHPPHGPHHDPVASAEAETACPAERAAAVAAREALLDPARAPVGARGRAARAAMAQAACEARGVADTELPAASQQALVAALRALRQRHETAKNLYQEAAGYGEPALAVSALVREAALGQAMAAVLAAMPLPVDVTEPQARAELRGEQADLVASFAGEAVVAAERALATAAADAVAAPAEVAAACEILGRLDPAARARQPACGGR